MNYWQNMNSFWNGAGMYVIFPAGVLLVGLLLKIKPFQAVKSGILMTAGFVGIRMMALFLCSAMAPALEKLAVKKGYEAVDVGWQALALSSWLLPFGLLSVTAGFLLNVWLVKKHVTRTLNTDIWDYCHILFCGATAYVVFHSILLSAGICLVMLLITVKCADRVAAQWQEHTESPGTTGSVLYHLTTMYPVYWLCDKIIDKIPVLKKIDVSADKLSLKMRPFSDSAIAGLIMGGGLGVWAGLEASETARLAFTVSLSLVLSGRITALFMEGVSPVSAAAKAWALARIGKEPRLLIGMDFSLGQGDPAAINASILLMPAVVILALILPGINFFPTSLLPNLIVYTCVGSLACRGNLFRILTGSVVLIIFMLYAQTWLVPLTTSLLQTAGMELSVPVTGGSSSNVFALLIAAVGKLMGKW